MSEQLGVCPLSSHGREESGEVAPQDGFLTVQPYIPSLRAQAGSALSEKPENLSDSHKELPTLGFTQEEALTAKEGRSWKSDDEDANSVCST